MQSSAFVVSGRVLSDPSPPLTPPRYSRCADKVVIGASLGGVAVRCAALNLDPGAQM